MLTMASPGYRLIVIRGPDEGTEISVRSPADRSATIGREGCDLLFRSDQMVSRNHAEIAASGKEYLLTDCGSTNGTSCRGKTLGANRAVALEDGDEFSLGPESVVRFELMVAATIRPADTPASRLGASTPRKRPVEVKEPIEAKVEAPADDVIDLHDVVAEPTGRFGHYQVFELLAEGDADRVERAIHEPSGRVVALKRFTSRTCTKSYGRAIVAETERAAAWDHPNVAQLVEAGECEGVFFVATEFVAGLSIDRIQGCCASNVDPALAGYFVLGICRAIAYVHEQNGGVAHGYVAPRGVVVGRNGDVKLINYGLPTFESRLSGEEHAGVYRPHEARNGGRLDARSDVCSLGFVLYELLTATPIDPRARALLPQPDTINPDIPVRLSKVTWQATRVNANRRFIDVREMESELDEALKSESQPYDAGKVGDWLAKNCPID